MTTESPCGDSDDSTFQRGLAFFQTGAWREALATWDQIAQQTPTGAKLHSYRACALESLGRLEDALECVDQALSSDPANSVNLRNRGILLRKLGRLQEALASFDAAIACRPRDLDLMTKRSLTLNEMDRREDALAAINEVLRASPNPIDAMNARAIILDNLGRYTDALADTDRMLDLQPDHPDAINNTGMLLARLGRFNEALVCYTRSLSINPNQPQARYNLSLIRLSLGDWIRGFREFEVRWETPPLNRARLKGLASLWLGAHELKRKTILIHHEQGYGDTLQCVRYLPLLTRRGARVVLAVPQALHRLMKSLPGITRVISGGDTLPHHDYHCPLMSLPWAFRTTPDTVPSNVPYLFADRAIVDKWAERLGPRRKPRIGLVWSGRRYAPINYPRDIALETLQPILDLPAEFICLQKDFAPADSAVMQRLPQLRLLNDGLEDFADTAAVIEHLDLVITVDTAVVHLAGAMGKPVWLLNRFASCWRWLQHGTDSAWYPSLRIFRQTSVGAWGSVITAVRHATESFLESRILSRAEDTSEYQSTAMPAPRGPSKQKIRLVCATRLSRGDFFVKTPLGRSLPIYRTFPDDQTIELRLFANNREGLPGLYNIAIEESKSDPAILIFIHDDVYLSDYFWVRRLTDGLQRFDVIGVAGNCRRVPRQASWMYLDDQFTCDNYDNLSGVIGHGGAFPDLRQLSVYGEPGRQVKLLDGVLLAVYSEQLVQRNLRFDPVFKFHFYDMDFCRQAEERLMSMGTWAISLVHASAGQLGGESWRDAYRTYLSKYGED